MVPKCKKKTKKSKESLKRHMTLEEMIALKQQFQKEAAEASRDATQSGTQIAYGIIFYTMMEKQGKSSEEIAELYELVEETSDELTSHKMSWDDLMGYLKCKGIEFEED